MLRKKLVTTVCGAAILFSSGAFATAELASPAANAGSTKFNSNTNALNDTATTAEVKAKLAAAHGLSATGISVSSANGVVALSGTVPTLMQKRQATMVAKKATHGSAYTVDNSALSVVAAPAPAK